jgi:hypothetical protein
MKHTHTTVYISSISGRSSAICEQFHALVFSQIGQETSNIRLPISECLAFRIDLF